MIFFTALLTGLFGSFHCAGMCGPIAFALPGNRDKGMASFYVGRLIYNLGRIATYACLGFAIGSFGYGLKLAGWQQGISIFAGCLILLFTLLNLSKVKHLSFNPFKIFSTSVFKKYMQNPSMGSLFTIGLMNGLLPCGFVYIGLIGAGSTQDAWQGAIFMICFGLGTLPMMYGVSLLGQFLSSALRNRFNQLTPVFALLIAGLFILRGLNLGIPYISPEVNTKTSQVKDCCKPANIKQ